MKAAQAALACGLLMVGGCGGEEPPQSPANVPLVVVQPAVKQPSPTGTHAAEQTVAEPEPDPKATPSSPKQASGTGSPCDAVTHVALSSAIRARESKELGAGMRPDGVFGCSVLGAGQTVLVSLSLRPGGCYTFLAHSLPMVTEIDVVLRPDLGPNPPPTLAMMGAAVLAQDSSQGPTTSVGAGTSCFKNPFPIPMPVLLEAKAVRGDGPVAIQAYSR